MLDGAKQLEWEYPLVSHCNTDLRMPMHHLGKCFAFDGSEKTIEALVSKFGTEDAGRSSFLFQHPSPPSWLVMLRDLINLRLNGMMKQAELLLYLNDHLTSHSDGPQLKEGSPIYVITFGISGYVHCHNGEEEYRLKSQHNCLYGFEYSRDQNYKEPTPRNLLHEKKLVHKPRPGEYALSVVFRDLSPFTSNERILDRYHEELKALPVKLDWSNISASKVMDPNYQYSPFKIPVNNPLVILNKLEVLLPVSNWMRVIGPGDEIHPNHQATALLGVHLNYHSGNSLCGTKQKGCCCIRLGKEDILVDDNYVIFFMPDHANRNMEDLEGASGMFTTSFHKQNKIAVLLDSCKDHPKRTLPSSQYYLNDFYIHFYECLNGVWKVHLRTSQR